MTGSAALAVVLLVLQSPRLANPVFAVDTASKAFELLGYSIDVIFAHFGNLIEAENTKIVKRLFDRRADTLDLLPRVPSAS